MSSAESSPETAADCLPPIIATKLEEVERREVEKRIERLVERKVASALGEFEQAAQRTARELRERMDVDRMALPLSRQDCARGLPGEEWAREQGWRAGSGDGVNWILNNFLVMPPPPEGEEQL